MHDLHHPYEVFPSAKWQKVLRITIIFLCDWVKVKKYSLTKHESQLAVEQD